MSSSNKDSGNKADGAITGRLMRSWGAVETKETAEAETDYSEDLKHRESGLGEILRSFYAHAELATG